MIKIPNFSDIQSAHKRILPFIKKTPVLTSASLNLLLKGDFYFKCENFQKIGAFKFRGATNAVLSLSEEDASNGVLTHSSGNHAAALSLAAHNRGIPAYIVMPENSPQVKINAVKEYGGKITFCKPLLEARESAAENLKQETGAVLVHPYNDPNIIAGQGTAALELIQEAPDLDMILAPVGGGGLMSGTALAVKGLSSDIKVLGVEPETADDAYHSLKEGRILPPRKPVTMADGLRTGLGELTFNVLREHLDQMLTVSEKNIKRSMLMVWERMKIVIEPSAAVPLAAFLENKLDVKGKKIGIIFSGGNVDFKNLSWFP